MGMMVTLWSLWKKKRNVSSNETDCRRGLKERYKVMNKPKTIQMKIKQGVKTGMNNIEIPN